MIEQYLLSLEGLARFQTVSFVLFFAVFCGIVIRVIRMKRAQLDEMARLPLDDSTRMSDPLHEVMP